jgi:DNA repair protein RadC
MTTMTTLYVREGSEFREAEPADILTRAHALISQRYRRGSPVLSEPCRTEEFLRLHLGGRDYEVFGLLHLNTRHRLIAAEDLFRGTLDGASVHPREVVQSVIAHRSAGVVLYHNHPSGASEPSQADQALTRRLKAALSLIDVKILDHLIVAEKVFSFSAAGIL